MKILPNRKWVGTKFTYNIPNSLLYEIIGYQNHRYIIKVYINGMDPYTFQVVEYNVIHYLSTKYWRPI